MNAFVAVALFGWLPSGVAAFMLLPARAAAMVTIIGGWLFLPVASFKVAGLPPYTKATAVSLAALAGLALCQSGRLAGVRFLRRDLPMLAWCAVPAASALANRHSVHEALGVALPRMLDWGVPYLVGRALFADFAAAGQLARGLFIGGLVYAPLCLYEMRMSPQLHAMVYGYAQHEFVQCIRESGYRPMVFMDHGLMVALWMTVATLAGFALWRYGGLRRLGGLPAGALLLPLLATTVLCRSLGALVLLGAGLVAAVAVGARRSALPVWVLAGLPLLFVGARLGFDWGAGGLVAKLGEYAPERASSLGYRVEAENLLLAEFWRHPWLGWSAWGVDPAAGGDARLANVTRDSYWIITLTDSGLLGLGLFFCVHLLPVATFVRRMSARGWGGRGTTGAAVLALALVLFVCDCMFNAMINPVYVVAIGSITSLGAGLAPGTPRLQPLPRHRRRLVHV